MTTDPFPADTIGWGSSRPLRVLVIDDDEDDRFLIRDLVEGDDGSFVCDVVDSYEAGERAILDGNFDACLVDYRLGTRSGIELIEHLGEFARGPLILLTGAGGAEIDHEALSAGAADYFEKNRLSSEGIRRSIRYAIRMWNERSRYQSLFDGVPVGLFRSSPEGLLLEVNVTAVRMLGYPGRQSMLGLHIPDLFAGSPKAPEASAMALTGPVTITDLEIAKRDGTTLRVDARLHPVRSTGGGVSWVEWAVTEVTQRWEAERQADIRAELLDQVNSAVIVTNVDGICTYWNRHAETMYGWTSAEAVGQGIRDLIVREEDAPLASEIMSQVQADGRWEGEFVVRRRDGSNFIAQVSNAQLTDENGSPTGTVGVSMDVTAAREAEAEHRRNEVMIAAAFESSPIGKVIMSPDLTIVSCNPAYAEFVGLSVDQLVGKSIADVTHQEDIGVTRDIVSRLLDGDPSVEPIEERFVRPSGRIVWGRFHASLVSDEHGNITHTLGQVVDITATKHAEDQARFQASVLDQVNQAVLVRDMTGAIIYWNHRCETLFGWTATEAIGHGTVEFLAPGYGPELMQQVHTALSERGMWEAEVALTRQDGTTFPALVSDSLIKDADGDPVGVVAVMVDMTDMKAAEQRAQIQEELNRTLLDTVHVPIAVVDANGDLVVANPSWELVVQADEIGDGYLPGHLREGVALDLRTAFATGFADVVQGRSDRFVMEYACGTRDESWFRTLVVPTEIGAVISHWDITDERSARSSLEATIRAKDEFIASVSHELRTPLTAVLGLSEALRSGTIPIDEAEELISLIADQAQEVALLVEDLLVAGRLDSDTLTLKPRTFDLAEETAAVLLPWTRAGNAGVGVTFASGDVFTFADPLRVRQILRNLVTNAYRYGSPPVTITGSMREERCIIAVTDHGEGIPTEAEKLIFEPYARFGPDPGQPMPVGLGLHVARRLARMMDGELSYRRHDGATVFELSLPTSQPSSTPTINRNA